MTTNMQGSHEATLKQSAIRKKLWGRGACFHGERRRETRRKMFGRRSAKMEQSLQNPVHSFHGERRRETRRKMFGRRSAKMEQSLQNPVHRRRAWVQNYCCTINEGGVRE